MVRTQRRRISSHLLEGDLRCFSELSPAEIGSLETRYSGVSKTSEDLYNAIREAFGDLLRNQAEHEIELYDLISERNIDKRLTSFLRKVEKLDAEYKGLGQTNQELLLRLDSVDYSAKIEEPDAEFLHQHDFGQIAHAFLGRVADVDNVIAAVSDERGAGRPRKGGPAFSQAADQIVEHWVRLTKSEPNLEREEGSLLKFLSDALPLMFFASAGDAAGAAPRGIYTAQIYAGSRPSPGDAWEGGYTATVSAADYEPTLRAATREAIAPPLPQPTRTTE